MKAAYFEKFGGPEVFQYGDLGDPAAAVDEVIVDVHAARYLLRLPRGVPGLQRSLSSSHAFGRILRLSDVR
jgi:hypothetical protein